MIKKESEKRIGFALEKENYFLLIIAVVIVIIGFILMSGGGSDDPNVFNEAIYGFRRTKLAPIITLIGFAFGIYAIMKKPKKVKE
jgi:membrane-bound ClpP family serine protease